MVNVLFTHSYFLHFDPKQLQTGMPYPPLATLYAAAVLREAGYNVSLYDVQFSRSPQDILPSLNAFKPRFFVVYDDAFNYLSKMCLTNMRDAACAMIKRAKEQNCTVIISSSDATDHAEHYLNTGADAVIVGEAEQTLLEYIRFSEANTQTDPSAISGLIYKTREGKVHKTAPRQVLKDLDQLPLPAWDLVNIEPYRETWLKHHGYFSLNFVTTRGCPYKCNWCAKPIYGNRYNSHAPERIVEQIANLQKRFGFTHIWFADDIFGLKPDWLRRFAEHCRLTNTKVKYKIQSRADLLLEEDNIRHLADSGCDTVWMGAESGSQKILDAMDKGTKVEQIYEATRLLKKNGIKVALFLQLGYSGETIHDIQLTLKMVKDLLPDDLGISVSYPLPGTKFYESVKAQLSSKSNWTDSDDLDLMFQSTYKPEFYKRLQRYIHHRYRMWMGLQNGQDFITGKKRGLAALKQFLSVPKNSLKSGIEKHHLKKLESDAATSL